MNISVYFIICSIFYSIMLHYFYFKKQHVNTSETHMFSIMLTVNLFGLFIELMCNIFGQCATLNSVLPHIYTRIYILYLLVFLLLFTNYIFIICYKNNDKKSVNYYNKISKISYAIFTIVLIFSLFLKLNIESGFADGPAVNIVFIYFVGCSISWLISVIRNYNKIKREKFIPIVLLILLATVVSLIQKINPSITLITVLETFVVYLMYFTIENPDVKLIQQLNIAKDQAEKANNAKSDFLSNMSHEIRTPLNAIVGFSNSLESEELSDEARQDVKYIISASNNLLELVNGILDISKIEAGKIEIVKTEYSTKEVLEDLTALTKARMGEKPIEFRTNFDKTIPQFLYGDYARIKQICVNLLTNSVKYTKEGYIEFKVDCVLKNDICRLIISVEDSGIGIKKENIDKLFTKFERLDLEKNISIEGTGLGLAITKKLVELMNGKIVVQSEYGNGSKFTVAIDQRIVAEPTNRYNLDATTNEIKDLTGKKVLVVDDNKLNLKVAEKVLEPYKVSVETVDSGQGAIDLINSSNKYDLILLDDMMPHMSGVETLQELKKIESFEVPVIALTANAISGMKEKYLKDGFNDYLAKPIEKNELTRILNKYLK